MQFMFDHLSLFRSLQETVAQSKNCHLELVQGCW